jgi:hypothetical protein
MEIGNYLYWSKEEAKKFREEWSKGRIWEKLLWD